MTQNDTLPRFATRVLYTDRQPFEIVRRVSDTTLEVRPMKAERDPEWKPTFVPGGFSAHCTNQNEQAWIITSDPQATVTRIRLRKNGEWSHPELGRFRLDEQPCCFHDYNF